MYSSVFRRTIGSDTGKCSQIVAITPRWLLTRSVRIHVFLGNDRIKQRIAILGGSASFEEPLHVGAPNQGSREQFLSLINDVLDRNWLTNNGPLVQQFEAEIAKISGVKHCIAMANGTFALQAAVRACRLTGEVIVPSFTFVATAHALSWQGVRPVFCDVDPVTHTLDVEAVERCITSKTSGIIGVHLWGVPCDTPSLARIAAKHDLTLMYDAAHAFGCRLKGRPIGSFGRCEVFSFHATKFVQSGEGGAVVTNDDELAEQLRFIRNFGFRRSDDVVDVGINGKMNELSAAMGLTSLHSLPHFVEINRANFEHYRTALKEIDGLSMFVPRADQVSNYQYAVAMVDPSVCPLNRDQLVCCLHAENVMARRYFYPGLHRMDAYQRNPESRLPSVQLPVTEHLSDEVLVLPTGTRTTSGQIEKIADVIRSAVKNAGEVKQAILKQRLTPDSVRIVHDFRGPIA